MILENKIQGKIKLLALYAIGKVIQQISVTGGLYLLPHWGLLLVLYVMVLCILLKIKKVTIFIVKQYIAVPNLEQQMIILKNNYIQVLKVNCRKCVRYAQVGVMRHLCANIQMLNVENAVAIILMMLVHCNKLSAALVQGQV